MLENIDSNAYPQSMFSSKNIYIYIKYQSFLSENFQFLEVKFSIYLNVRVFVMHGGIHVHVHFIELLM